MSTPKPTIKKPPTQPDRGALVVSDYPGTAMAATKTSHAKRGIAKKQSVPAAATRWTTRSSKGIRVLQVPAFSRIPWLVHAFSTRPGGASILEGKPVLNLGFTEWDSRENVRENRHRFQSALGADKLALVPLLQFHPESTLCFHKPPPNPSRADASITNRPGLLLAVQTADSVPLLLPDPTNPPVAPAH